MTDKTFAEFKKISQTEYGTNFSKVESITLELGVNNAVAQFAKLKLGMVICTKQTSEGIFLVATVQDIDDLLNDLYDEVSYKL